MVKFSLRYGINKFIFHWVFKKPKGMKIKVSLKSKRFLSFHFRVTLLRTLEDLVFIFLLLSADNYKGTAVFKTIISSNKISWFQVFLAFPNWSLTETKTLRIYSSVMWNFVKIRCAIPNPRSTIRIVYQYSADACSELHQASKMKFICENSQRPKPTNFFRKKLYLICPTGFGILLCAGNQMNWNNLLQIDI